jgi:hypothetical protein
VDFSHVFDRDRWRRRFRGEQRVVRDAVEAGRTPDATVDEVGAAVDPVGFDGRPRHRQTGNGQGSGDVGGGGWAGWGGA